MRRVWGPSRRHVGRDRRGRSNPHVGGPRRPFYALDEGAPANPLLPPPSRYFLPTCTYSRLISLRWQVPSWCLPRLLLLALPPDQGSCRCVRARADVVRTVGVGAAPGEPPPPLRASQNKACSRPPLVPMLELACRAVRSGAPGRRAAATGLEAGRAAGPNIPPSPRSTALNSWRRMAREGGDSWKGGLVPRPRGAQGWPAHPPGHDRCAGTTRRRVGRSGGGRLVPCQAYPEL